jgi:hypothetical protein
MMTAFRTKWPSHVGLKALATAAALILLMSTASAQRKFETADQAASALAVAIKSDSKMDIIRVLGRAGDDIIDSGDEVSDARDRERFTAAYDAKHSVVVEGEKATLLLGAEDFPFPIPIKQHKGGWKFDAAAGRIEILYRRIGRNELDAIQTCLAYVDAQTEYAEKDRTGAGAGIYAQHIVSTAGKKDGLYWPASDGDESPLGELVARASAQGYTAGAGRAPYHGYYYRILTQQGPNAPGGTLNYVVRGKMIGGFALLAYPAEYGNSGVMTFLVNHSGTVYQKDLGDYTATLAKRMMWFDPDQTWKKVDVPSP